MPEVYALPIEGLNEFRQALSEKSDRARVVVVASWIDLFLKAKFMNEFSKGNSRARKALFSAGGPFGTLAGKINVAFCAGWIDPDVHHDLHVIRRILMNKRSKLLTTAWYIS